MNFIGVVTIATPGKLQELSISMETPSLTAASAGSAPIFASAANGFPRIDAAATGRAVPLDRTPATRQGEAAPGVWESSSGSGRHQPISAAVTVLRRNGQPRPGRSRKQTGRPGDLAPRRRTAIAHRFSPAVAG